MSQRTRLAKASGISSVSPAKSKKKSNPIRKKISTKKSSPSKRPLESPASILTQPRQKRLCSLTAAALVHYCTSILSPSRKSTSKPKKPSTQRQRQTSNISSRSDSKHVQTEVHTRTRREASSRASAMIMQQNEIERSRRSYSSIHKQSTSVTRRQQTKRSITNKDDIPSKQASNEPMQLNIPPIPQAITNVSNQSKCAQSTTEKSSAISIKYPSLTETLLAEHDRINDTLPSDQSSKHDSLIKWTQEIARCGRLSPHDVSLASTDSQTQTVIFHSSTQEKSASVISNELSRPISNNVTATNFPFSSTGYSLDLHRFYPLLPCWQYPTWSHPSSSSLIQSSSNKTSVRHSKSDIKKSATSISKAKSIVPGHKQKLDVLSTLKEEVLTLHLHTHHHQHIHNSTRKKPTTIPSSPQKSSLLVNDKEQRVATKTISPLRTNNVVKQEHEQISAATEDQILNLSTTNTAKPNQQQETIKKTTRRKSSPVERCINSRTKSNSSSTPSTAAEIPHINNSLPTSPSRTINNREVTNSPRPLNIVNSNGHSPVSDQKSPRRALNRRSVSAATTNSPIIRSITSRSLRGNRTNSASCVPVRSKSSINKKRSHSPVSIISPVSSKRKKQQTAHYWILSGKSEQKLVSVHADKPPVFRECYSSIRHVTEKDIIKSNDCVILRPESGTRNSTTPYLAKVKWFWQESTSDEILMSLIWYYHPEHTELSTRVKECFLPNELLASRYSDCVNVACIEDKCYVLNLNEYNRYCLREKSANLFEHSEPVGQLKSLLNKNTPTVHHRSLPARIVGNQNIFFCRYVYDYRVKRVLKNPSLTNPTTAAVTTT